VGSPIWYSEASAVGTVGERLGSVIGFVQFFRISSQIYKPENRSTKMSPLMSRDEDTDD